MLFRVVLIISVLLSGVAHADSFDVQIGAFRSPDVSKITLPANVGELRSISGPDGLTRFVVGPFAERAEAEQVRDTLRGSGFGGAFLRETQDARTVIRESAYVAGSDTSQAGDATKDSNVSHSDARQTLSGDDEEGEVVYLDGRLHRKVGSQFVPIRD